jgi:hypothetical protein
MITIRKIDEKNIGITDGENATEAIFPAQFSARSLFSGSVMLLSPVHQVRFSGRVEEFRVLGAGGAESYETAEALVSALNGFVGNFNPAGGTASTTLPGFAPGKHYYEAQAIVVDGVIWTAKGEFDAPPEFDPADWNNLSVDKANKVKFPALPFDGSALNVFPPRILHFDVSKTPEVTGLGGQGFVAWQVAGHAFHLFGAWVDSVNGDGKTRIGLFQFQDGELTSVRDIFDGDVWLESDWTLTYGINGTRQDVGTLSGFDFATDMTIPALPNFDLSDVAEYMQKKIPTSFGNRTVLVSDVDGEVHGDEVSLVEDIPDEDSPALNNQIPTVGAVHLKLKELRVLIDTLPAYGVEFDTTVANPACTRIGRSELHKSLPIQSKMRRCLLNDDGTVNYYLNANDSTLREDGAAANLTGADGQVMVEIPGHYRKFEVEGTKIRVFLSEYQLPGFHLVPKTYRSAYEAAIDRTVAAEPKLASVVNPAPEFRGGNNTSSWDGTYRSLLGRPGTVTSLTNFRTYARRRGTAGKNGAGWNCEVYDIQKTCYWLYVVEYANLNSQAPYNAQPDANGYRQGGLGDGVTTLNGTNWNNFNGYNPFIACGYTNSLGNRTGLVSFAMPAEYGATLTVQVPSYRGLENPFGHVWKWTDGCKLRIQSNDAGGLSEFFVCTEPDKFQDNTYDDYEKRGNLPRNEGYIKEMLIAENGENMSKVASGASSTTYFCDYFYTSIPSSGESKRGVLLGGGAADGASAGLACAYSDGAASAASARVGSRLCFIPV